MKYTREYGLELEKLLQKAAKDKNLLREFLNDLLSPAEYKDLSIRWQIIRLLHKGEPQRNIAKKLNIGIATVTRGARELLNKKGGFKKVLDKFY